MKKIPVSTEAQREVALKIKYKEVEVSVDLANKMLDVCCEHLKNTYPDLSTEKALEIAVRQVNSLISNPDFLFKDSTEGVTK